MPIALVLAHSVFVTLTVTFPIPVGEPCRCDTEPTGLGTFFDSVSPSHVFKGKPHFPICLVNFYKGDDGGRKRKNVERKKSASLKLVAIPRNRIKVTVSEGLALSQLVPESLSPVDILSEAVPVSLRPVESLPVCLPTGVSFNSSFGRICVFFI